MQPAAPRVVGLTLLAALGAAWMIATGPGPLRSGLVIVAAAAAVAAFPSSRRVVASALDRLRTPTPALRRRVTFGIGLVTFVYLIATAFHQDRDLFPKIHDEHSYVLQTRMLAIGRLWMPRHPLADFFESFHILTEPVYASIYFPGTAVLNVPGVWAGQPTWAMPVLAAALVVALTYRCVTELVDGTWGIVAAIVIVGVGLFRTHSTLVMSQMPAALLGMLTVWGYLKWRHARRPAWALAVGAFAGWAAITRPVDALAYAIPVGLAMALDLRGRRGERAVARSVTIAVGAVVAGALPFLLLQVIFDRGVTGSAFKTPYALYLERYQPGSQFGFSSSRQPTTTPATALPQKREYSAQFLESTRVGPLERLRITGAAALPTPLLLPLVPLGLLGMFRGRRWVLGAAAPLFFLLYLLNPFYLPHYSLPLAPALALWLASAGKTLEEITSSDGLRPFLAAWLAPAVAVLCLSRLPELDRSVRDDWIDLPAVRMAHDTMPQAVRTPAVVLFRYRLGGNFHDEPVYNDDVAWPDDAPIIRAHDLGLRNREIIEYYARQQPDRNFYRYDRGDGVLTPLGTAAELAAKPNATPASRESK